MRFVPNGFAQGSPVKIVGIGASSCSQFIGDVENNPKSERDYLAWAQGYMSGLLIRAPAGKDENLDLTPPALGLVQQADFLRMHCSTNLRDDFSDAVNSLYRTLRSPPG